jgi:hypothetical protein
LAQRPGNAAAAIPICSHPARIRIAWIVSINRADVYSAQNDDDEERRPDLMYLSEFVL